MAAKRLPFLRFPRSYKQSFCKFCLPDKKNQRVLGKEHLLETAVRADHDQCAEELIKTVLDLNSHHVIEAFSPSASL